MKKRRKEEATKEEEKRGGREGKEERGERKEDREEASHTEEKKGAAAEVQRKTGENEKEQERKKEEEAGRAARRKRCKAEGRGGVKAEALREEKGTASGKEGGPAGRGGRHAQARGHAAAAAKLTMHCHPANDVMGTIWTGICSCPNCCTEIFYGHARTQIRQVQRLDLALYLYGTPGPP